MISPPWGSGLQTKIYAELGSQAGKNQWMCGFPLLPFALCPLPFDFLWRLRCASFPLADSARSARSLLVCRQRPVKFFQKRMPQAFDLPRQRWNSE